MNKTEQLLQLHEDRHYFEHDFTLLRQAEKEAKEKGFTTIPKWQSYDLHDLSEVYKGICEDLGCTLTQINELEDNHAN